MTTASSTFDTTQNPISEGGVWTSGPGTFVDVQIVSGQCRTTAENVENGASYTGVSWTTNQTSEITIGTGFPASAIVDIGPLTRVQSSSNGSCYHFETVGQASGILHRIDDSGGTLTFNQLGAMYTGLSMLSGTLVKLGSNGSTHTPSIDGAAQTTRTDATYSGGSPGFRLFAETGNGTRDLVTAWTGTDDATAASMPNLRSCPFPLVLFQM